MTFFAARRFSGRAEEPDVTGVCDFIGWAATATADALGPADAATVAFDVCGTSVSAAAVAASVTLEADKVDVAVGGTTEVAKDVDVVGAETAATVCPDDPDAVVAPSAAGVLVLTVNSVAAGSATMAPMPVMMGGVAAVTGDTSVCDWVRARLPRRLTWAGGRPRLYSTISSSKRLRFMERDEL